MIRLGEKEIAERIKEEAQAERDKILGEAEEKASEMISEVREEIELRKKDFAEDAERKGLEEKERIIRAARLNARKVKWNVEEEMTERALAEALTKITEVKEKGFRGNSYSDILSGLIKEASISILAGGSEGSNELAAIVSDEDASYMDDAALKRISAEISKESRVDVSVSLSDERIKSAGGVIVRGKDGKIEVNNTFERRMARFSSTLREGIAKSLFTEK